MNKRNRIEFLLRRHDSTRTASDKHAEAALLELFPHPTQSQETSKGPRKKRKMLAISRIDESLLQEIRRRAEQRGICLYKYCNQLLRDGLLVDDLMTKQNPKADKLT